ncbi:GAF domain-containing protein [Oscillatoria salina]|uniref:GAF domain-containing protein n=1 Tax=Oscillatoria salina TaxID=331517 RepID=UPI001CCDD5AD|nr:GAF domain-containing protein [Oscillatoria salina]MBZ8183269.1 GAF domain-containing protein [Oscillatoria salina IIICB1]
MTAIYQPRANSASQANLQSKNGNNREAQTNLNGNSNTGESVNVSGEGDSTQVLAAVSQLKAHLEKVGWLGNPALQEQLQIIEQFTNSKNGKIEGTAEDGFLQVRQLVWSIGSKISQCKKLDRLLNTTVNLVRENLQAERVVVYRFQGNKAGVAIAESMVAGYRPCLGQKMPGQCFGILDKSEATSEAVIAVGDIYQTGLNPYPLQILEQFQVKSFLVVPILLEGQAWGLLAVQSCAEIRFWQEWEINLLDGVAKELSLKLQPAEFRRQLQQQAEQDELVNKLIEKIQLQPTRENIFRTTCQEIRAGLKADRAVVYHFFPDWRGEVVAESVGSGWVSLIQEQDKEEILRADRTDSDRCILKDFSTPPTPSSDTYLKESKGGRYRQGKKYTRVDDIYAQGFSACYIESLEKYQAKAYIIVPIFQGEKLWGLLGVYQNSGARKWKNSEVNLMVRLSAPLGVALQQAEALETVESQSAQLARAAAKVGQVAKITDRLRQSYDFETILAIATEESRQMLNCDRVGVYRFNPDWSGEFIAESYVGNWVKLVGLKPAVPDSHLQDNEGGRYKNMYVRDTYLQETEGGRYRNNEYFAVDDIYKSGHAPCHIQILEQFQARAYVIVPIFKGVQLWGLLAAYQNSGPRKWEQIDAQSLARVGERLGVALQEAEFLGRTQRQADLDRAIVKLFDRVRKSADVNTIFRTTTQEVRRLLNCDRVGVYRFNDDWSGKFIAESVSSGWASLMVEERLNPNLTEGAQKSDELDTYLQQTQGGAFNNGVAYLSVNDIYEGGLSSCYIELLEKFQARAYIIVPIFLGEKLWGLLGAYQNSGAREWQEVENNVLVQIGSQLGVALQQAEYLTKLEQQSVQLAEAAAKEKAAREQLQQRAVQMLIALKPSFEGDLTVRAPITEDEIGTIADAYNNTIQSLRKLVTQVKTAAEKVGETAQNNAGTVSELSQQAESEVQALNQGISELEKLGNTILAVADSAQKVEVAVEQANQTVATGDRAMNRTVDGIQEIRRTVSEASQKVKRLGESSQKITKVVNLISNFATQTNLLALNAAIEATRAGEYGRGFGVVADEVRSLARQSAEATSEIEKLVQDIQREIGEVALAMDSGIEQVVAGSDLVTETRENLNEIVQATAQISGLMKEITSVTQAQTQQSKSVTKTIEEVAAIARSTSTNSVEMSASFQALVATAEELQASVGKFKVS